MNDKKWSTRDILGYELKDQKKLKLLGLKSMLSKYGEFYHCKDVVNFCTKQQQRIEKLEDENKKLRECVEFYADKDNWFGEYVCGPLACTNEEIEGDSIANYTGGKLARQTLKEIDGE